MISLARLTLIFWLVTLSTHSKVELVLVNSLSTKELFRPKCSMLRHRQVVNNIPAGYISSFTISLPASTSWSIPCRLGREEAQSFLGCKDFLPPKRYGDRIALGRVAQGICASNDGAMKPDDPRLTRTYAEFPLTSLDILLDAGNQHLDDNNKSCIRMVDIGSGLGRIVFYAALTRGGRGKQEAQKHAWKLYGVEIAPLLHEKSLELAQHGTDNGAFVPSEEANHDNNQNSTNSFSFHLGPAQDFSRTILNEVDIVFAYSTAFSANHFSPDLGALILDPEWSEFLGHVCPCGCVAITTDRALDPLFGWILVDRIDVENPEVFGSTGYIHVLQK